MQRMWSSTTESQMPNKIICAVEFLIDNSDEVTLNLFEDKLQTIYELYKKQHNITKDLNEFTDDDTTLMCLKVSSTVFYNDRKMSPQSTEQNFLN